MTRLSPPVFFVLLVVLNTLGLASTDMYLPSLPALAREFLAAPEAVQRTLGVYLAGLAVSQIFYGPLSDRFGRRPILVVGLLVYAVSSLACFLAPDLGTLVIARFFQAVGACSGMVVGRAVVRDRYDRRRSAEMLSVLAPVIALSPAVAPVAGGYFEVWFGWRSVFLVLSVVGSLTLVLVAARLEETNNSPDADATRPARFLKNCALMLGEARFRAYVIAICCAYAAYFAYLTGAPFLFAEMGLSPDDCGYFYIAISLSYVVMTLVGRRLIGRISIDALISRGLTVFAAGGVLMFLSARFLAPTPAAVFLPMAVVTAGNGFILSFSMAGALSEFPELSGTASGLVGSLQLAAASLASAVVGRLPGREALAACILAITLAGAAGFVSSMGRARDGDKARLGTV